MFQLYLTCKSARIPLISDRLRALGYRRASRPWVRTLRRFLLGAMIAVTGCLTVNSSAALYAQTCSGLLCDFGNQIIGTTSTPPHLVPVTNFTNSSLQATANPSGDFKAQGCSAPAGQTCFISVTPLPRPSWVYELGY